MRKTESGPRRSAPRDGQLHATREPNLGHRTHRSYSQASKVVAPGEQNIAAHPVDRGIMHPARFRGRILDSTLTLTIQFTDTTVTLGPVLLTFGKEPRMGPCPICRRPRR